MNQLLSFDHFSLVESSNAEFDTSLDAMFEDFAEVVSSPIKYTKIKNNAKKYQKALLTKALADVEYEKKKKKGLEPTQKEVLIAATKAKKAAMDELTDAISQRMEDLATNEPLQTVVKLAKTKARISAAEALLKIANDTESDELQDRIERDKKVAAELQSELKSAKKEKEDS